jgi:hypothetical protein
MLRLLAPALSVGHDLRPNTNGRWLLLMVPGHEWRGYVPMGQMFSEGFARVHKVAGKSGDTTAWKTVRYDMNCEQLQQGAQRDHGALLRCDNIVACVDRI